MWIRPCVPPQGCVTGPGRQQYSQCQKKRRSGTRGLDNWVKCVQTPSSTKLFPCQKHRSLGFLCSVRLGPVVPSWQPYLELSGAGEQPCPLEEVTDSRPALKAVTSVPVLHSTPQRSWHGPESLHNPCCSCGSLAAWMRHRAGHVQPLRRLLTQDTEGLRDGL